MIPWLKVVWRTLLFDPRPARRLVRGLLLGFGAASPGLVALLPVTGWWRVAAYMVGGLAACLGGLLAVGEPNSPDTTTTKP